MLLRFSLAKVQLALWFFVIFGAFIIIWLSTGNYDTINSSIVAVLGISAGTALGDSYIKSRLESRHRTPLRDGPPEKKELIESTPSLATHDPDAHPLPKHLIRDLVSDSDGYSIYRFQIIAWTVILIAIFISSVYYNLTMPEFRPDLLYLLGLHFGDGAAAGDVIRVLHQPRLVARCGVLVDDAALGRAVENAFSGADGGLRLIGDAGSDGGARRLDGGAGFAADGLVALGGGSGLSQALGRGFRMSQRCVPPTSRGCQRRPIADEN